MKISPTRLGIIVAASVTCGFALSHARLPGRPPAPPAPPAARPVAGPFDQTQALAAAESWLRRTLQDPDSLVIIESAFTWRTLGYFEKAWSHADHPDLPALDTGYALTCRYRARNEFGGYQVAVWDFIFTREGRLITEIDAQIPKELNP